MLGYSKLKQRGKKVGPAKLKEETERKVTRQRKTNLEIFQKLSIKTKVKSKPQHQNYWASKISDASGGCFLLPACNCCLLFTRWFKCLIMHQVSGKCLENEILFCSLKEVKSTTTCKVKRTLSCRIFSLAAEHWQPFKCCFLTKSSWTICFMADWKYCILLKFAHSRMTPKQNEAKGLISQNDHLVLLTKKRQKII